MNLKREVSGGYIKDGSYIPELVKWDLLQLGSIELIRWKTSYTVVMYSVSELPVHRSFMFGDEFIYKTGIDGEMNAKFYVKEAGSAGTLDPIQPTSISWFQN